ncbi:MAG: rhodanese-like domain-containing protein [Bacillota bacterium]
MIKDFLSGLVGKGVEEVTPQEVEENDVTVIDCRNKNDYQQGHIPGAINIPYGEFKEDHPNLADIDQDEEVVVNCVMGVSSQKITRLLNEAGYDKAKSMKGGIKAWEGDLEK